MHLLLLSYAKRTLVPGSREHERMRRYAAALAPDPLTIVVLTRQQDALPTHWSEGNLTIIGTNTKTRLGLLRAVYSAGKRVLAGWPKGAVVSAQDPFELGLLALLLARSEAARLHVQVHGDQFGSQAWAAERPGNRLRRVIGRFVLRRASRVRVVSGRSAAAVVQLGVPPELVTVLPIEADLSAFLAVGKERTYTSTAPVRLLFVGRFSVEKNIPAILTAFAALPPGAATLTLVGAGPLEETIRAQVSAYGIDVAVTILPWQETIAEVMAGADVFVLASHHEGYAMVLAEAAAAGLPILTTDVGCVGEVVRDGEHALVVADADSEAFASALVRLVRDPALREALGSRAYQDSCARREQAPEYVTAWTASF